MDFNKWNKIARGEERTLKKISELEIGKAYQLEEIHKTPTKFGDKVTVCLTGKIYCYLPAKLSSSLLADEEAGVLEIINALKDGELFMRRLTPRGMFNPVEFITTDSNDQD